MIENLDGKIYLALKNRLDTMSGDYQIVEGEDTFSPSADTPYIVSQDARLSVTRIYAGANDNDQHLGLFSLSVLVPTSWTIAQGLGVCGVIRSHFSKGIRMPYGDCVVKVDRTPEIKFHYVDGAFRRFPVVIRWRSYG